MTKSENRKVAKYIGDLCVMLDITPPRAIFESKKPYPYIYKTLWDYTKFSYIDNYRLPKKRLIKQKINRHIRRTENSDYDLYVTDKMISFIIHHDVISVRDLFYVDMDKIIHELAHIKYGINIHSHKFFRCMDKLKIIMIYNKHREIMPKYSILGTTKDFYKEKLFKKIKSKIKPHRLKKLRKMNPRGYYSASYWSIVNGISPYEWDKDKLIAFNSKWIKSKYIGGKR